MTNGDIFELFRCLALDLSKCERRTLVCLAANPYRFAYFLLALCALLLIGPDRYRIVVLGM